MFRQAIAVLLPMAGDPACLRPGSAHRKRRISPIRCFTPRSALPIRHPLHRGTVFQKAAISPSEPATLPGRTKSPRIIAKTKNFPINGPTQNSCAAASSKNRAKPPRKAISPAVAYRKRALIFIRARFAYHRLQSPQLHCCTSLLQIVKDLRRIVPGGGPQGDRRLVNIIHRIPQTQPRPFPDDFDNCNFILANLA